MANPGMPVCKSPSGQTTDSDCKIVELISLKPCHPTEIQHVLNMFCIYNKFTVTKKLSYDRKMRKILKQTCFPIPLLIPNAISFHHWHDLAWLHPHDWHVCPKWHDTHCMNSGHQIIVVQSVSKLDLTPSNQKQKTWSWLDHSVTARRSTDLLLFFAFNNFFKLVIRIWLCDLNAEETTDANADLTISSHHVSMNAHLFMMWNKNEYSIFWQKEFWNQEMFFSFQLPKFEWPTISHLHWWKERQSNSSHKLEHTARNDSPPPMHKLTGQLNLCLCNEQLMIIKHSNHDLTWPFKTLTWHYKIEFSEDLP